MSVLRKLSPTRRGVVEAASTILGASVVAGYGINRLFSDPAAVSGSLAQIGATLLVAYAVQVGWVIQNSRKRGASRENWAGATTGVGCSGLTGIVIALCLSTKHSLNLLEELGFAWSVMSIGFLGLWIAVQPWAMYDMNHRFNTEYPDE
jgi:hypothetical protein